MSRARSPLRLALIFAITAAATYLIWQGVSTKPREASTAPAKISPSALYATELVELGGKPQPLGRWQGKLMIVNFWATWCAPCRDEIPLLVKLQDTYRARNVVVIGIAVDDEDKIKEYLRTTPVNYPILVGGLESLDLAKRLGNVRQGLPYTVIVDAEGNVIRQKLGPYQREELESDLRELL